MTVRKKRGRTSGTKYIVQRPFYNTLKDFDVSASILKNAREAVRAFPGPRFRIDRDIL